MVICLYLWKFDCEPWKYQSSLCIFAYTYREIVTVKKLREKITEKFVYNTGSWMLSLLYHTRQIEQLTHFLQWNLPNGITLGQRQTDSNNRLKRISK